MSQVNWEYIIDTIKSEKCVLLLGPEIPLTEQGEPLLDALASYLGVQHDPDILYFNDDEFFLFKDERSKFPTYLNIQKFYNQTPPAPIYHKLAQLPFHLIISLSPDLLLKQTYERHGLAYHFDFYRKYRNPQPVPRPSAEKPLIYNLFGSVEDDESLIFTHDDMFEFLFAISNMFQLPDELKNELSTAKNFILLGFKFDKWYVKLILRLFNLHSGRFLRYAPQSLRALEPETKEWYELLFKVNFVEEGVGDFTDELFRRCQEQGMLKELGEKKADATLIEKVRQLIGDGQLDKAINEMNQYLNARADNGLSESSEEDLLNDLTLIASSYRRVNRRLTKGTIKEEDAEVKLQQIKSSLLDIASEIKSIEDLTNAEG